jgi:hypothetical protein
VGFRDTQVFVKQLGKLKKGSVDLKILAFTDEKSFDFVATMDKGFKVNLEPKNTLLKMFVGEIYFQYNSSKKLIEYVGKLDMKNSEGESPQVRTVYESVLLKLSWFNSHQVSITMIIV